MQEAAASTPAPRPREDAEVEPGRSRKARGWSAAARGPSSRQPQAKGDRIAIYTIDQGYKLRDQGRGDQVGWPDVTTSSGHGLSPPLGSPCVPGEMFTSFDSSCARRSRSSRAAAAYPSRSLVCKAVEPAARSAADTAQFVVIGNPWRPRRRLR